MASENQPKMLHFYSKVTPQTLKQAKKIPDGNPYVLAFTSNPSDSNFDRLNLPIHEQMKLTFVAGSSFKVLKKNPNEGSYQIQIPDGVYTGILEVNGRLFVNDPLYYIKADLITDRWSLGKRAFPIPKDWRSDDGAQYVLSLQTREINSITFKWYPTDKIPDFPPGTNKIGSEGGMVELPGVGKVEFPAGALTEPTVIVMKEILQAKEVYSSGTFHDPTPIKEYDFIAPIIKFEPFLLQLNRPATVYLNTDLQRLGNNHSALIDWRASPDAEDWRYIPVKEPAPALENWTPDLPTEIGGLVIVTKLFPANASPTTGGTVTRSYHSEEAEKRAEENRLRNIKGRAENVLNNPDLYTGIADDIKKYSDVYNHLLNEMKKDPVKYKKFLEREINQ